MQPVLHLALLLLQNAPPATPQETVPPVAQQVQVNAQAALPIGETARTVYTLDSTALHDYPAVTLDESLRQHAGFELFRRAPSRVANPTSEGISLRGLGSTAVSRTLVLEDGAPLNDPFGGWIHWNEQPAETVRSVELVTGGGSDLYGSSALGGVIDITPESPAATNVEAQAVGGSQSTSDVAAAASFAMPALGALVAGESLRTAGYVTTAPGLAGLVDIPAGVDSQSYRAELGRRNFDDHRLLLTGNMLNETRGNGTPLQTNATRLWRYLLGYDTPETGGPASARLRLFGSDEGYRQSFSSIAADRGSETLTRLQRVHTDELGGSVNGTFHLRHLAAIAGADVRDLRAEDNETPISKGAASGLADVTARQRYIGGFGELLGSAGAWSGAASVRVDRASNFDVLQTAEAAGGSSMLPSVQPNRTEVVASPRLGLVRTLSAATTFHASGFRAFRAPSMNELYRTGQVGQDITLANPALNSERATGFEAGFASDHLTRVHLDRLSASATYFWTVINRPVSAVQIAQTATNITNLRENLGQIRSQGVEITASARLTHALDLTANYQYADALVTKFSAQPALVGLRIPQVPAHSFTAQLRGTSERLGEATLAVRAGSRAFDDSGNLYPLNGFVQVDLSAQRTLGPPIAHGHVQAFVLAQNLTDRRQQVARTPILTLGSPFFAEAGLRFNLGHP